MHTYENHSRGYLPHVVKPAALFFVTFRLADSLPRAVLDEMEEQLEALESETQPPSDTKDIGREKRRRIESYLDRGAGACYLKDQRIAAIAIEALRFFHGQRYELGDWVVMPNHIHALVRPINGFTLSHIVQTWKRRIARESNRIIGKTGERFWQPESFDRVIRDDDEKLTVCRYIRRNPVKAGLCQAEDQWRWSSAWTGE